MKRKISSKELNYKFDIVGSGTERDKINKMIDKHNLTNIKVHPHTQKIKQFYDQADLFFNFLLGRYAKCITRGYEPWGASYIL